MAEAGLSIHQWLHIQTQSRLSQTQRVKSAMGLRVLKVLESHAPQIAALSPKAPWNKAIGNAVLAALHAGFPTPGEFDYAHDQVSNVIRRGNRKGLWSHKPWPLRGRARPARSPLKAWMARLLGQRSARAAELIGHLPRLLDSRDANIVGGALLVAAADFSAVLLPELLVQVVETVRPVLRHESLVWMDFTLGTSGTEDDTEKPARTAWRNVRRWFPDDVSLLLLARYRQLAQRRHDPTACLAAYSRFVRRETLSLDALIQSARAEWVTQLPMFLYTYATQPQVGVSLPLHAWGRLITGEPLPEDVKLRSPRKLAYEAARRHRPHFRDRIDAAAVNDSAAPLPRQLAAVEMLMQALRKRPQDPLLSAETLRAGLMAWDGLHGNIGGWPGLMRGWVEDILLVQRSDPSGKDAHWGGPSTLLRYLGGFSKRWVEHFHNLPPSHAFGQTPLLASRLETLARDLASMTSAPVAHAGLRQFLQYVADIGGPRLRVKPDGSVATLPRDADANLLSPIEYSRLLEALRGQPDSYVRARARCLSILAYRVGPRWQELQTRQLRDLRLVQHPDGTCDLLLKIRKNEFFMGKTDSAHRTLLLSGWLARDEMVEVRDFLKMATSLGGKARPQTDFLFADADALHSPPREELTHDLIQDTIRKVSGDPTLVFHSLRHAAANAIWVRLFLEQIHQPKALAWMPGASIWTAEGLGYASPWMTVVTGRRETDPSRLYVISKTLGQLGPETALQYYVHLVDLVLAREVAPPAEIPDEVAAVLEHTQPDSIRRRRNRGRPLLQHCLEQARATFPEFTQTWGKAKAPWRS